MLALQEARWEHSSFRHETTTAFLQHNQNSDMIALTEDYALRDKSLRKQDRLNMLAEAHQQAAEDIEKTIVPLQATSYAARVVIEGAWGGAFHWIAFCCETKHQSHQESHAVNECDEAHPSLAG